MKRRGFAIVVAMVAVVGVAYAGAQATAPAQKKAVAKKEAGEKAGKKEAGEAKLQLKDLPPAVKATVEAETKNATLKGFAKEKENGKTVYELESLVNGRTRDLMIDSAGKVYEVEEQLDVNTAPAPVKAALEAKGKVVVLESVMTNGKTHYEGQVQTKAGKKVSFDLDADGEPIKK
jgi:uncharacterized membrane protein YkoI